MTKKLVLLFAALALFATACGGSDDDELSLVSSGTLTVCTDVPYPPMEFEDPDAPGGYSGFDIELMRAIADDLGLDLAVATPGWDAITSGLANEAGDCDISAASITITEEREENIDFSDPYFDGLQSLLVADDSSASTMGDLAAVAVQSGTTGETFLEDNTPAGVTVTAFEGIGDMYVALEAGTVDGVITDLVGNQGYVDENGGAKVIETYATDEVYGFAVQEEGKEELLAAVNESLASMRTNGTYDDIFEEFFPSN
ncbi:MAG: transporter substrate-binding domain-containing protein [Actinomycetota bacterium]